MMMPALGPPGKSKELPPPPEEWRPQLCPLCGATILENQVKCRFCGSIFESPPKPVEPSATSQRARRDEFDDYAVALLAAPVVLGLFALLFIAPLNPLRSPGFKFFMVMVILFISMAMFVIVDADRLNRLAPGSFNPVQWFVRFLVGWPRFLTDYFRQRTQAGRRNWVPFSRISLGVFLFCVITGILLILVRPYAIKPAPRPPVRPEQRYRHIITEPLGPLRRQ